MTDQPPLDSASALLAECRRQQAEIERLRSVGKAKSSTISALCDTTDEAVKQARIEAFEECAELVRGNFDKHHVRRTISLRLMSLRGLGGEGAK